MRIGFKCSDKSPIQFNAHARMHSPKLTTYFHGGSQKANFSNNAAAICVADILLPEVLSNEKAKREGDNFISCCI